MVWRKRAQAQAANALRSNEARLKKAGSCMESGLYIFLETNENGLTDEVARERCERDGLNEVIHAKAPSWISQLLSAFVNPFIGILIFIAAD